MSDLKTRPGSNANHTTWTRSVTTEDDAASDPMSMIKSQLPLVDSSCRPFIINTKCGDKLVGRRCPTYSTGKVRLALNLDRAAG